jgi:hypothetical protein
VVAKEEERGGGEKLGRRVRVARDRRQNRGGWGLTGGPPLQSRAAAV